MKSSSDPSVLHIVESVGRGSVESWLLRMASHARRKLIPITWTLYCTLQAAGPREEEARALGIRIVRSPVPIRNKMAFAIALREEVRNGRYRNIHSQHDLVSGFYLAATLGLPVVRRLVHVHNADEEVLTDHPVKKSALKFLLRQTCLAYADTIVANSNHSLDTFLAGRSRRAGRDIVHTLGVDPAPFAAARGDRIGLRRELGLAENALILLFAGRMTPEKNPLFAVDVLAELRRLRPDVVGVFVGAGSLEEPVRRRIAKVGLEAGTRLLGWREDVPEIMCASDWFILPHPEHPVEAFGIAVVEAQLAGLRLLLSRGVLDDPLLSTAAFRRLSLAEPPVVWAQAALSLLAEPAPSRAEALVAHRASPMEMDQALNELLALYR